MKKNKFNKNLSKPLRLKIRELSGLTPSGEEYFNREEIISILKAIEPNLKIVINKDDDPKSFIPCGKLFEFYLGAMGIWKSQKTVSNHPRLPNLQAIHKKLVQNSIKQKRRIKNSRSIQGSSIIITENYNDISKIFNSLPSWVEKKTSKIIFEGKNSTRVIIDLRSDR
jgi:hypothetical protein